MSTGPTRPSSTTRTPDDLAREIAGLGKAEAAGVLERLDVETAAAVLQAINPAVAGDIIPELEADKRESLFKAAPVGVTQQWSLNLSFPDESVGRLMEMPPAVFRPHETVGSATERIRALPKGVFFTYAFIVDEDRVLTGLATMRDLLTTDDDARLDTIMLRDVFTLQPAEQVSDAMEAVVHRHFPVYPVVDDAGRLLGQCVAPRSSRARLRTRRNRAEWSVSTKRSA